MTSDPTAIRTAPPARAMSLREITEQAKRELATLTGFGASSVIAVRREGEEWRVEVELLEKAGIPDRMDILGWYEVRLDARGAVVGYERKGMRKRGDAYAPAGAE